MPFRWWLPSSSALQSRVSPRGISNRIRRRRSRGFRSRLPEGQQFTATTRQLVSISPDGTQVVYVGNNRLYVKPLRELGAIQIQGTETLGIQNPVFSPDGRSIAFYSPTDATLKKIFVSGGTAVTICPAEAVFGISWGGDGQILVGQGPKGILRVSETGGKPETIIPVKNGEVAHGPQLLPGKKDVVLFTVASGTDWNRAKIVVQPIGTDEGTGKRSLKGAPMPDMCPRATSSICSMGRFWPRLSMSRDSKSRVDPCPSSKASAVPRVFQQARAISVFPTQDLSSLCRGHRDRVRTNSSLWIAARL